MYYVDELLSIFGVVDSPTISENFDFYEIEADVKSVNSDLSKNDILKKLEVATGGQFELTIAIKFDGQDPVRFSSNNIDGIDDELGEYSDRLGLNTTSPKIEIRIDKPTTHFHIFDLDSFTSFHRGLDLEKCFSNWSRYDFNEKLEVLVWGEFDSFKTSSIVFYQAFPHIEKPQEASPPIDPEARAKAINNRDKCSHFVNAKQIIFIPEDFRIYDSEINTGLKKELSRLFNCLAIAFIADFSSFEENDIKYRLKGYKLISETLPSNQLANVFLKDLDEIYQWVYGDGDFSDKVGLARNIISIHLSNESILSIESGTADSARSGYDLYLKENVKQYIEIKNKISEFILSQSDKATEIPKNMFGMFKTNLWTFVTFFISVFLLRVLKDGKAEGIFTIEILVVSFLLVLFSFVFLVISTIELNSDKKRLLGKYTQIQERYKDLLDKKDLKKLFDAEELSKRESEYIDAKRNLYVLVWFITNIFLLVSVIFMYCRA